MYSEIHLCIQKFIYVLRKSLMCSEIHLCIQKFLVMDHNEEERLMESFIAGGPTFTEEERSEADAFLNITGDIDTRTADIDNRAEDNNEDLFIVNAEGSNLYIMH